VAVQARWRYPQGRRAFDRCVRAHAHAQNGNKKNNPEDQGNKREDNTGHSGKPHGQPGKPHGQPDDSD
jgi:hypothetical protein